MCSQSYLNTNHAGVYYVEVCTVARGANMVHAKILFHRLSSSSIMSCTLNVRIILPFAQWALPNMKLAYAFVEVIGFTLSLWSA